MNFNRGKKRGPKILAWNILTFRGQGDQGRLERNRKETARN